QQRSELSFHGRVEFLRSALSLECCVNVAIAHRANADARGKLWLPSTIDNCDGGFQRDRRLLQAITHSFESNQNCRQPTLCGLRESRLHRPGPCTACRFRAIDHELTLFSRKFLLSIEN